MLEIDGSMGEGGGQVLRTALSVACVLQKPVRIFNIRAGRAQPGLKPQHLTVCRLLGEITGGKVKGDAIGSSEIIFEPGEIAGGEYSFDIGTAGSCTLLLQAALPVLAHSQKECVLKIIGGTHVKGAPTLEYFSEVFLPAARKFGVNAEARMISAGFYPKGGGKVELRVQPSRLHGASFQPQENKQAYCRIISCRIPAHVADREKQALKGLLAGYDVEVKVVQADSSGPGNAVTVWSGPVGASALGEAGKPAEKVSSEACSAFLAEEASHTAVDSHLADQLLVYAALSEGKTSYTAGKFTQHLKTNAAVLSQLTGRNIILAGERQVSVD